MKLCICQPDIVWENKQENMRRCRVAAEQASENGASLIVFPEMSITGFSINPALADHCGETLRLFSQCSSDYKIACGFGYAGAENGEIYNRFAVTDKCGGIVAQYAKIHPFSYGGERAVFSSGHFPVTAQLCGVTLGLAVCYDLRFPELFQRLSQTADCIIVIANFPESRREHWLALLKARAIENQCYIAGCNRIGNGGGLQYSGDSVIFAPDGRLLACAANAEMLIYEEISHDVVMKNREEFPFKKDRREDLYRKYYC